MNTNYVPKPLTKSIHIDTSTLHTKDTCIMYNYTNNIFNLHITSIALNVQQSRIYYV
jgi:hypothetical protein